MGGEIWCFVETGAAGLHKTATKLATEAARLAQLLGGEGCAALVARGAGGFWTAQVVRGQGGRRGFVDA
jgi:hypothetical protein